MLPTLAAAALVVSATGASVTAGATPLKLDTAGATPLKLDLDVNQAATAHTEAAADEAMAFDLAQRRQEASMQTAALQGRVEQQVQATRDAKRKAVAKAKADRLAKRWVRPIKTWNITSDFGWRWGKTHDGVDFGASTGTPLYAMSKGVVIGSFVDSSFGNKVEIRYWDGTVSWYGHLSKRSVAEGDTVKPGQLVGLVGNTGHSFGSHLHLEIQRSASADTPIDPMPWLRKHGLA